MCGIAGIVSADAPVDLRLLVSMRDLMRPVTIVTKVEGFHVRASCRTLAMAICDHPGACRVPQFCGFPARHLLFALLPVLIL